VAKYLREPAPAELREKQQAHLRKWCHRVDGTSSKQVADVIARALKENEGRKNLRLNLADHRRGGELKLFPVLYTPYTYFPLPHDIYILSGSKKPSRKMAIYRKSISPAEVREAAALVESCVQG